MTPDRYDDEHLAELLRSLEDDDFELEAPPDAVWAGILADLGEEAPGAEAPSAPPADDTAGPSPVVGGAGASITPLAPRRRSRGGRPAGWFLAAAAAAVLVALVAVGQVMVSRGSAEGDVAARATLTSEGLTRSSDLVGRAELVRLADHEEIALDLPDLPAIDDAYYEVWLLAPDGSRLQSLGSTRGSGRYVVPTGIDPHQFPVVDVSLEPPDGDPTHSGDSLVRGRLDL